MDCIDHGQAAGKRRHGHKMYKGKVLGYHVYAYCVAHGLDPHSLHGTGTVVRHKCDNPRCINPEHLELGTAADNIRDAIERQGAYVKERNAAAKLKETQVVEIRERYAAGGISQRALAKQYGVAQSQIWRIVSGGGW